MSETQVYFVAATVIAIVLAVASNRLAKAFDTWFESYTKKGREISIRRLLEQYKEMKEYKDDINKFYTEAIRVIAGSLFGLIIILVTFEIWTLLNFTTPSAIRGNTVAVIISIGGVIVSGLFVVTPLVRLTLRAGNVRYFYGYEALTIERLAKLQKVEKSEARGILMSYVANK